MNNLETHLDQILFGASVILTLLKQSLSGGFEDNKDHDVRNLTDSKEEIENGGDVTKSIIDRIENIVQRDEGKRGIGQIIVKGELYNAAVALNSCTSVAIITGFPCNLEYNPPTETDGPLGAIAIARALLALGKRVILLTDECNEEPLLAVVTQSGLYSQYNTSRKHNIASSLDAPSQQFEVHSFPGRNAFTNEDHDRLNSIARTIDACVAIERAGPAYDGKCRTMKCRDMTDIVAPLEKLMLPGYYHNLDEEMFGGGDDGGDSGFISTSKLMDVDEEVSEGTGDDKYLRTRGKPVCTIGIGDGGNEVGMGKFIMPIIHSTIPHAMEIACVIPSDHCIVSSVSNWGGYALAGSLTVLKLMETRQKLSRANISESVDSKTTRNTITNAASMSTSTDSAIARVDEENKVLQSHALTTPEELFLYAEHNYQFSSIVQQMLPSNMDEFELCVSLMKAGARDGVNPHKIPIYEQCAQQHQQEEPADGSDQHTASNNNSIHGNSTGESNLTGNPGDTSSKSGKVDFDSVGGEHAHEISPSVDGMPMDASISILNEIRTTIYTDLQIIPFGTWNAYRFNDVVDDLPPYTSSREVILLDNPNEDDPYE